MKVTEMIEGGVEGDMAGAQDTIYLCNFRVSVDGEWLCLKELHDVEYPIQSVQSPSPDMPPAHNFGRDPVVIERSNLVNISKLVVKELIEQSLRYGRMLDSDHMPLQHFFIVLEHVLRHGLRPKKGLLGPKKELWDILQTVEKYAPEAQDITSSVRDLPTVSTHMGRARAWLRLALMQKKLADYLKVLIDHKDEALAEYFEPDALMLSDEAIVIIGLLVGLNVIDCNLCVKEEDLDCPQGVIDFSLYLRSSNQVADPGNGEEENHMTTVLDQKNYIEELNRHLNATVTNLQNKVESLTTTNALMKEDLAIAKNNLGSLHEENKQLRLELGREEPPDRMTASRFSATSEGGSNASMDTSTNSAEVTELKQRLEEERKLRQEADKELQLQMDLKAEMEVAMKLLEKDIHEKQDTIISLRRQLDDIKLINLEMYKKLQECEGSLKHKTELVGKLEAKTQSMTETLVTLENKFKESESSRLSTEAKRRELDLHLTQHEEMTNNVEGDLRVEREWRQSLQETMQKDRDKISQLQHELSQLRLIAQKMVRNYKRKTEKGVGAAYSSEDLEKAVSDVKNGNKTTRGAAAFYNIPRSTLKHYVLGTRGKGNVSQDVSKGGGGVKSYLPASDEEELANGIRIMEKNGFGLTREEVLDIVQCYIAQNKLITRFKNQRPGEDWFQSFRKRNRLSIKKPQSIEYSRCDQTNPWVIYDFFDKLTQVIKELGLNGKPGQIYNCDETSFCHDPSKTRVVGAINVKSQRKTSASGRENTTTLLCVSADGKMIPLLCVFKGKFVMDNWVDEQVPTQTAVSASERGWMETTLFFNWFRDVFLTNIGSERPVLLLYDGHSTHISTNLIRLAQQNQVTIMKLPPHTTHVLQPLDVAVFRAMKQKWDRDLCKWQRQNPRKKIPKPDFISLLSQTAKDISSSTIINGFRITGIYDPDPEIKGPNRKAIPESIFSPIDLVKYKKHQAETLTTEPKDPATSEPEQQPMSDKPLQYLTELPQTLQVDSAQPSTSHHDQALTTELEQPLIVEPEQPSSSEPQMNMEVDLEQPLTYTTEQPSPLKRKTFEELLLDLVRNDKNPGDKPKKRRKIVNNCEIITTSKYLEMKEKEEEEKKRALIEKEEKRIKREENAKAKKLKSSVEKGKKEKPKSKTQEVHYDSSSDENDYDAYSTQEREEDFRLESLSEYEDEDKITLEPGEFCIVKVFGKNEHNFRLYVAKVIHKEDDDYMVLFYKRHDQTMKFKETDEESYIREIDIIRKLPQPVTSSSARFNNMIGFAADLTDLTNIH